MRFCRSTLAPATTAPEGSVTVPSIVPAFPSDWAKRDGLEQRHVTSAQMANVFMLRVWAGEQAFSDTKLISGLGNPVSGLYLPVNGLCQRRLVRRNRMKK